MILWKGNQALTSSFVQGNVTGFRNGWLQVCPTAPVTNLNKGLPERSLLYTFVSFTSFTSQFLLGVKQSLLSYSWASYKYLKCFFTSCFVWWFLTSSHWKVQTFFRNKSAARELRWNRNERLKWCFQDSSKTITFLFENRPMVLFARGARKLDTSYVGVYMNRCEINSSA